MPNRSLFVYDSSAWTGRTFGDCEQFMCRFFSIWIGYLPCYRARGIEFLWWRVPHPLEGEQYFKFRHIWFWRKMYA